MPVNIHKALNYNEQKVKKGVATCIAEGNFLLPVSCMNFYQKKEWFEKRIQLNSRAQSNTIHISLNFHPSEKLKNDQLKQIADEYMFRIGFGDQPYLVYQHNDAGHPHLHIVSVTIREDGSRINTHNIGRNQSEMARKLIEAKFQLMPADHSQKQALQMVRGFDLSRLEYGKTETRRGIANILTQVIGAYNYTSLPQLNAILKQFSILADRGKEDGFVYQHQGLQYRVLDQQGNKVGVPIKASALPGQPTLKNLQHHFNRNQQRRAVPREALQQKIAAVLDSPCSNLNYFIQAMEKRNVHCLLRQNEEGRIYGITFIDHQTKAVFNGSEIARAYSIAGIQEALSAKHQPINTHPEQNLSLPSIELLLKPENDDSSTPYPFRIKRKRKNTNR